MVKTGLHDAPNWKAKRQKLRHVTETPQNRISLEFGAEWLSKIWGKIVFRNMEMTKHEKTLID